MKTAVQLAALPFLAICGRAFAANPAITALYTPDPAPVVADGRVWLFCDHDEDDSVVFKMKDWLVFSSEDMVNWTYHGAPLSLETFAWAKKDDKAWASQAVKCNGKWYWYICCNCDKGDAIGVAVADRPAGPWTDPVGRPLAVGASFIDPTVFVDDDDRAYLVWGNKTCQIGELNEDMISFKGGWREMPGFEDEKAFGPKLTRMNWAHGKEEPIVSYEEGPWLMKRGDTYYLSYPAGGVPEHMAYSTAPSPIGPWTYRGKIMDLAENSFTIHGGNIEYKGHSYMFYHNGKLPNGGGFKRSTCIEEFTWNPDGTIPFIRQTREGVRAVGTVDPFKRVEAETMSDSYGIKVDRTAGTHHWITRVHNGDWLKVSVVDFGAGAARQVAARAEKVRAGGTIEFFADGIGGKRFAAVTFAPGQSVAKADVTEAPKGVHDVFLLFRGGDEELFDLDCWQLK